MGKKYLQRAAGEGRVAILPEFLQEGREVWYWRETLCDDELCLDMVGPTCPMNRINEHIGPHDPEAIRCAMMHPVLDCMEIWHVTAAFTPRGSSGASTTLWRSPTPGCGGACSRRKSWRWPTGRR